MSSKFEQLTPESINLIKAYRDKWKKITLSTKRIEREQAEKTVSSVYEMLGYKLPIILFFDSPYAACNFIAAQTNKQLSNLFGKPREIEYVFHKWQKKFRGQVYSQIDTVRIWEQARKLGYEQELSSLRDEIGRWGEIDHQIGNYIWEQFNEQSKEKIQKYFGQILYRFIRPGMMVANSVCQMDYLISAFKLVLNNENWETYKSILGLSNYIFLQEKACLICDRPVKMSFDFENRLHAEGKLAIQFADKTGFYSHHGKTLPTKYGKLNPKQWQTKWLSEENSLMLREALVEGLGYAKIRSESSVTEVDCWQNYILIKINISLNSKLIYLLKINIYNAEIDCAMEIPYDLPTVRQAADSINWDIESENPEELEIPF